MKRLTGLVLLLGLAAGCDDQEIDALRRVGDKAMAKVSGLADQARAKVKLPLPEMPPAAQIPSPAASLAEQVRCRLKWDRPLADLHLEVRTEGNKIMLSGLVHGDDQRRRAVALAESTVGVDTVIDQLSIRP